VSKDYASSDDANSDDSSSDDASSDDASSDGASNGGSEGPLSNLTSVLDRSPHERQELFETTECRKITPVVMTPVEMRPAVMKTEMYTLKALYRLSNLTRGSKSCILYKRNASKNRQETARSNE
jgi:hypothetical protein